MIIIGEMVRNLDSTDDSSGSSLVLEVRVEESHNVWPCMRLPMMLDMMRMGVV